MDELSPESRALYEILMSPTKEEYEARFLDYKKGILNAVKIFVNDKGKQPKSVSESIESVHSTDDFHEPAAATSSPTSVGAVTDTRVPAAASLDSAPASVLSSSTATDSTTPATSRAVLCTKHDLTPEARRIYDFIVGGSAAPTLTASPCLPCAVPCSAVSTSGISESAFATGTPETDLHSVTHSTCSTKCLGGDMGVTPTPSSQAAVPTSSASTPALPAIVSATADVYTVLRFPAEMDVTHDEVDSDAPTSCTTTGNVLPALAPPVEGDKALDVDDTDDTAPTAAICLLGGHDCSLCGEHPVAMSLTPRSAPPSFNAPPEDLPSPLYALLGVLEQFSLSPTTCSIDSSGRELVVQDWMSPSTVTDNTCTRRVFMDMKDLIIAPAPSEGSTFRSLQLFIYRELRTLAPPRRLTFCFAPDVTAIAPWPPPSYTRAGAPLIHEHDLFHNAQLKHGKEFLVVWLMRSTLSPPVQDVKNNEGQWSAKCPEVREDRHQSERIIVVKLKPPWLTSLGMCMNLPRRNGVIGFHSRALVAFGLRSVCLQFERLIMAEFAAAANFTMVQYLHCKGPPDPDESDCLASRYFVVVYTPRLEEGQPSACVVMLQTHKIYSTRLSSWKDAMLVVNQWTLMRCTMYVLNSFLMELVLDGNDSSCLAGHCIQRDYELIQWKFPWLFSCPVLGNCLSVFAASPDVPTFMWLQFAITCNLSSQADLLSNITIELKPWPSWELFPCISTVTSCLRVASHILASSVLILKGIYSRSSHYLEVHLSDANLIRLSTPTSLHAGELYWLLGVYSSCNQFFVEGTTYFGSQLFEWQIPWCFDLCHAISSNNWLQMQPADGHWKFNFSLLFSWDVTSIIDSVPTIKHISGMFSHTLPILELGNYFAVAILLLSSHLSQVWVLYLPTTSIMQCGSKMMLWEFASSNAGILTYTERVLISWDPGGPDPVLDAATSINKNCTHLPFSYLT